VRNDAEETSVLQRMSRLDELRRLALNPALFAGVDAGSSEPKQARIS
jgi:hypothetical protein